jgi:uncharacterized membrane protein YphA (DoxX/SURF4 family)
VFAAPKLAATPTLVEQFHLWGLPPWMMTFVGVAQLCGGVGFFIRNIRLPSSFAMGLVMIGATVTLLASGHERAMAPLTILLAALCFAVALHRLLQFAREKAQEAGEPARPMSRAAVEAPLVPSR